MRLVVAVAVLALAAPASGSTSCSVSKPVSDQNKAYYQVVHKYGITAATGRRIIDAYCGGDRAEVRRLFAAAADREFADSQNAIDQVTRSARKTGCPELTYYEVKL